MTGKRHNQYEVDPGSPAMTDNRDGAHDQHLKDADKGRVAQTPADERSNLIPKAGVNPALAELRARNDRAAAEARGDHNRGGGLHGGATPAQQVDSAPDAGIEIRGGASAGERAEDAERTE